jgi:hypothetical protein
VAPAARTHDEGDATRFGGDAIFMDRRQALELLVVDQQAVARTHRAEADRHVFIDAIRTKEHTLAANLERAVVGEQIRYRAPLRLVDVVAVGVLHDLDFGEVLEAFDARAECIQFSFERLQVGIGLGMRSGRCKQHCQAERCALDGQEHAHSPACASLVTGCG